MRGGYAVTLPRVPAGYSGTPLARKLGIKAAHHVALVRAPTGWTIEDLPAGVRISRNGRQGNADVVVAFFQELSQLRLDVLELAGRIKWEGALWVAWPRRAGGHTSDITDNEVRSAVLPLGLVDVKVAALDTDWSALKMVWRKELRSGQ
jgi:hypothetical protein